MPTFITTLTSGGGNTTGIEVPATMVEGFGRGKRVPLVVTVGDHTYRSSVSWYRGAFMISVGSAHREAAGVAVGDEVEVTIQVDDEPRTVEVPADLAEALAADDVARANWASLSFSNQNAHALSIEGAKSPETRGRRVAKVVETLRAT